MQSPGNRGRGGDEERLAIKPPFSRGSRLPLRDSPMTYVSGVVKRRDRDRMTATLRGDT